MANDVVLGSAMRSNLLSLQNTQRSIDATQLRLATGKKVNSALDNPQSFFQAQSLNNRASDLTRLLDGIGQSIQTIQEADKGITALTSLVDQATSIAEEAQSVARAAQGYVSITGTKDLREVDSITADSSGAIAAGDDLTVTVMRSNGTQVTSGDISLVATDTVYSIASSINSNTTINPYVRASVDSNGHLKISSLEEGAMVRLGEGTTPLGSDGFAFLGLDGVVGTENTAATTRQGGTMVSGHTLTSQAALAATATNGVYQSSATLAAAGFIGNFATATTDDLEVQLTVDGTSVSIGNYINTNTIQDLIDDINTSGLSGVTASFDTTTGKISLAFDDTVGTATLQFGSNDATSTGDVSFGFGSGILGYGTNGGATDLTTAVSGDYSERFVFGGTDADLSRYATDYNKIRSQIDDLVNDANYRGVNLLAGDNLTTYFNEDSTSSLVTTGADFSANGLGLSAANFTNAATIQMSIDESRAALDQVRNFGSSIANDLSIIQTRQDFTEQTVNTLKAGASALTDADLNEEGATLLALQTAQQLGVTSLSLASQSQQSVLRLF